MKKNKRGISLIVLIVTIIVIIILAAAVILTLSKNNPVESAREARFKEDIRNFQSDLSMYLGNQILTDIYGTREKITSSETPSLEEMKKYISSFTKKYEKKLGIEEDELVYFPNEVSTKEKKWLDDLGIMPAGFTIHEAYEECFMWKGNTITGYYEDKLKEYLKETNGVLKIPKRCDDIGTYAFSNCDLFTSVIFQDEKEISIQNQAFRYCENLRNVHISKTVILIGKLVFNRLDNLVTIEVDEENPNYSSKDGILYNKDKTTLIAAPGTIETCKIPDTVKIIGGYAFENCEKLKEVEFPKGLTEISYWGFGDCYSLTNITLPESLVKIGNNAFCGCRSLKGEIIIPDNVESIGGSVFSNCHNITKVILGKKVKEIENNAFYACNSQTEFEVDKENNYFNTYDGVLYDKNLTKIVYIPYGKKGQLNIPKTFTTFSLTYNNLSQNKQITKIEVDSNNPNYSSQDGILYDKNKTNLIFAPSGLSVENLTILDSVENISDSAFNYCRNVTGSLYIPEGVKSIGSSSFSDTGLSGEVNIPSSVTTLGKNIFRGVRNITKININEGNANYSSQDGIVYNKDKSTLLFAPEGITINNLTLPDSVRIIEERAFYGCNNISGILKLNNNLETIKEDAFCQTCISEAIIPATVTTIENNAFYLCYYLKKIKCVANSKPDGWDNYWFYGNNISIEWGYSE